MEKPARGCGRASPCVAWQASGAGARRATLPLGLAHEADRAHVVAAMRPLRRALRTAAIGLAAMTLRLGAPRRRRLAIAGLASVAGFAAVTGFATVAGLALALRVAAATIAVAGTVAARTASFAAGDAPSGFSLDDSLCSFTPAGAALLPGT